MKVFIAFFFFFITHIYACNLCKMEVPNVHIEVKMTPSKTNTLLEIKWEFDQKFLRSLKQYDLNKNSIYEDEEQKTIKNDLLEYLGRFNYLTQIAYIQNELKIAQKDLQKIVPIESKLVFENDTMDFVYSFTLPIVPKGSHKIVIQFYDLGNNFNFIIKDIILKNYDGEKTLKITSNRGEIIFDRVDFVSDTNNLKVIEETNKNSSFLDILSLKLEEYKNKMKTLIEHIKDTNSLLSYSWLILFSFAYGVLHAIGPGHGKSLVSAYFLSENHSTKKALSISLLIGVVHTFSAFILTVTIYFILNMLFANIFDDIELIATKISGAIIIVIALYVLYRKYSFKKQMVFSTTNPNLHEHTSSCGCGGCSTKSTDLGVILSAGIVPCAGTISVFLFTMGLGVYFVGFVSAIFMSLGMSFVIFITAYLSKNVRKSSNSNEKLVKFFEYGSLVFILILGCFLMV